MVPVDDTVFGNTVVLIPWDDYRTLGVLSSALHHAWVMRYASTLETRIRYSANDCFNSFPFPGDLEFTKDARGDILRPRTVSLDAVADLAVGISEFRSRLMVNSRLGLTKVYGSVHDPSVADGDIVQLRDRHVELDRATATAYGWDDIDLKHGFHETRYGTFFTVSTEARFELLMRLLELNFMQYAEQTGMALEQVKKEAQSHG